MTSIATLAVKYDNVIIGIHRDHRQCRYMVLNFALPVYMRQQQSTTVDPAYQFMLCKAKVPEPNTVFERHKKRLAIQCEEAYAEMHHVAHLHDTHELTPHEFVEMSHHYDFENVTKWASLNDVAAMCYQQANSDHSAHSQQKELEDY
ncbi:hypothetical protein OAM67_01105 [bacterium]|nr:hypothetical protein [bacterium]